MSQPDEKDPPNTRRPIGDWQVPDPVSNPDPHGPKQPHTNPSETSPEPEKH